jgi:hypothetical protein
VQVVINDVGETSGSAASVARVRDAFEICNAIEGVAEVLAITAAGAGGLQAREPPGAGKVSIAGGKLRLPVALVEIRQCVQLIEPKFRIQSSPLPHKGIARKSIHNLLLSGRANHPSASATSAIEGSLVSTSS